MSDVDVEISVSCSASDVVNTLTVFVCFTWSHLAGSVFVFSYRYTVGIMARYVIYIPAYSVSHRCRNITPENAVEVADTRPCKTRFSCLAYIISPRHKTSLDHVLFVLSVFPCPCACPQQFGAIAGGVYPELLQTFISKLIPVNFDMDFLLSYSCVITNDFYDHLILATIAPLVALVMLASSYMTAKNRNSTSEIAMRAVLYKHQSVAIYFALIVYSPVSYRIFQTFSCDELDDGNTYVRADYNLSCSDPRHSWYEAYALVMVGIYPVGIAALFAWFLGRHRYDLVKPDRESLEHLRPLRGMWAAYRPRRYYFEVVECVRRIGLTIIAVFVLPGSREQLAIALLFAVACVFITEVISPYENNADMNLYRWGNGIVVASMYVAFLLKIEVAHDETPAMLTFSGVVIAANVFMVVTVLLQTLLLVKAWRAARTSIRAIEQPLRRTTSFI